MNPEAFTFQPEQPLESFEGEGLATSAVTEDCNLEALKIAASRIQRWYRHAHAEGSICKSKHPMAVESNSCSAQSYRDTCCCLCNGGFHFDMEEADACDLCLEPYRTKCLNSVDHPVEPYSVCENCIPEAQLRASAAKDKNNAEAMEIVGESLPLGAALESDSASQDDAAFVSSMGEADVTTETASNHTWPDFSETQARDFQQWFSDKLKSKREVAIKSVQRLGEKAEAQGDIAAARRSLTKAGEIQKAAEEPFNTEHMRQESWVFLRELQRL